MRTLLIELKNKFVEIESAYCDSCDRPSDKCICDESLVDEQNVTSAVAGFNIPTAFAKPNKWKNKKAKYEGKATPTVAEIMDVKYLELIEGYRNYKQSDKPPSIKVKESIREIAKKLQEIETIVGYTSRFKTESNVASSEYGPAASKALTKISERLIKISERVRTLGE